MPHHSAVERPPPTAAEIAADREADKTFNRFEKWQYGLCVLLAGQVLATALMIAITDALGQVPDPAFTAANWPWAWALLAYLAVLIAARLPEGGTFVLYEMLWGCNMSMVLAAVGILCGRPMLVGIAITTVGMDQACWYVDTVGYILLRKFLVGAAKYMLKPDCSTLTRLTSLHHLWFLPLCFWIVRHFGLVRPYTLIPAATLTTFLGIWCRILTPYTVPLSAKDQRRLGLPRRTINVNCAYGFWADVPIGFLHWCDHMPAPIYLAYLSVVGNSILNAIPYVAFRALSPN